MNRCLTNNLTMKKSILSAFLMLGVTFGATSQINPHAIGLRGDGGNYGAGVEISYQHGIGDANRIEGDLGLRSSSYYNLIIFSGMYHWAWNITSGLNWYVGPGVQFGLLSSKGSGSSSDFFVGLGGQIGLEFDFNDLGFPILLSLDTRPMWAFSGGEELTYGGGLGIRYTF